MLDPTEEEGNTNSNTKCHGRRLYQCSDCEHGYEKRILEPLLKTDQICDTKYWRVS